MRKEIKEISHALWRTNNLIQVFLKITQVRRKEKRKRERERVFSVIAKIFSRVNGTLAVFLRQHLLPERASSFHLEEAHT